MRLRLWHVLALMSLILVAGVLSIQQLEAHVGRTTVPGVVCIDVPGMDAAMAQAVTRHWPGALLQWAPAGSEPLSPFGPSAARALRSRGHATALLAPRLPADGSQAAPDPSLHEAWGVLVSELTAGRAAEELAAAVRAGDGVRPFLLGLVLPAPTTEELIAAVARQVEAAETLPSFRRTTVLVLGAREPESKRRLVVRIDRGDLQRPPPPALADLLAETP
ncbi:MAG TPA: hypothetical protein VK824_06695 [Planctomycetota bacterium]|nr:hypothetical protein [Planctomycetota bacterium]